MSSKSRPGKGAATLGFAILGFLALQLGLVSLAGAVPPEDLAQSNRPLRVPQFSVVELVVQGQQVLPDPFGEPLLLVEVTGPGESRTVEGFFDGDGQGGQSGNIWKARFCPNRPGIWKWKAIQQVNGAISRPEVEGEIECIVSGEPGPLVTLGSHFELAGAEPFSEVPLSSGAGPLYLVGNFLDLAHGLRSTQTFFAESTTDAQRTLILNRQRNLHDVNFINFYLANRGDYDWQSVTPWVGNGKKSDKTRFDLSRWKMYEEWIEGVGREGMLVCLWFFADDSGFSSLSRAERERYLRYAMARTSAFSHTFYMIGLEYEEAFSDDVMREMGEFLSRHNPWSRLISTHMIEGGEWNFRDERWAHFITSQAGNESKAERVNGNARKFDREFSIPHLSVEFGHLRSDFDVALLQRTWANLCGGAAGSGTGSGLKSLQRFLRESRVPFQRMNPRNDLVDQGGMTRFCLAEPGHHYLVYSMSGNPHLRVDGDHLRGVWYDPYDSESKWGTEFPVEARDQEFVSPDPSRDWVLWISDGTNLNSGRTHPGTLPPIVRVNVPPMDAARALSR